MAEENLVEEMYKNITNEDDFDQVQGLYNNIESELETVLYLVNCPECNKTNKVDKEEETFECTQCGNEFKVESNQKN